MDLSVLPSVAMWEKHYWCWGHPRAVRAFQSQDTNGTLVCVSHRASSILPRSVLLNLKQTSEVDAITEEETEASRGSIICPWLYNWKVV